MEVESQVHLYGHTGEVTSLFVCKPYSILISVSKDGTCILWDLNRWVDLTYGVTSLIRQTAFLVSHNFPRIPWRISLIYGSGWGGVREVKL